MKPDDRLGSGRLESCSWLARSSREQFEPTRAPIVEGLAEPPLGPPFRRSFRQSFLVRLPENVNRFVGFRTRTDSSL